MRFSSSTKVAVVTALALVVVPVLFLWLNKEPDARNVAAPTTPQPTAQSNKRPPWSSIRKPPGVAPVKRVRRSVQGAFLPQEVIGARGCHLRAGRGNAAGFGLVVLPAEDGARFEVLDGEGRVLGDTLPFMPNHYRLARHASGSIITGFGDLRLNSLVSRPEDTPEPVRIYRDEDLIYETDKAWNFGLAPDGSAFFVVEPTSGGASRLVIRNLHLGTEYQHDLGYSYTPVFNELPYGAQFTTNAAEVMLTPAFMSGGNSHIFFPSDGGHRRAITLKGGGAVVFESMRHGYYAFPQGSGYPVLIQKKELRWGVPRNSPRTEDVWSREVNLENFYGNMSLSDDAAWLILKAGVIHVLDTQTGATVFAWPRGDDNEQFARLSTVLPADASVTDVGGVGSVDFIDGQLLLYRIINPSLMRPTYYFDVFTMAGIELDSKPQFRVQVARDNRCLEGDFALRGLQVVDGALTYLTHVRGQDNPPDYAQR